jgi:hypothetical protein
MSIAQLTAPRNSSTFIPDFRIAPGLAENLQALTFPSCHFARAPCDTNAAILASLFSHQSVGSGAAIMCRLGGFVVRIALEVGCPADQGCRGMTSRKRYEKNATARSLNRVGTDNLFQRPVNPLDQQIGLQRRNRLGRVSSSNTTTKSTALNAPRTQAQSDRPAPDGSVL